MATLTIRNLDESVRDFLRQQAASHGRSMEAEVRAILEKIAKVDHQSPGAVFRRIHEKFEAAESIDDLPLPARSAIPAPLQFDE